MKRTVAKLVEPKRFELFEEEIAPLGDHEVLYKTLRVGLCHSEMGNYLGKSELGFSPLGYQACNTDLHFPISLGHEPICEVVEVGKKVTRFKPGDLVTGKITQSFASYLQGDFPLVVKIPDTEKSALGCLGEPMFCAANIIKAVQPTFGERIAVVGCGFMGLLVISGLKARFLSDIVALDLSNERLELAKRYGATKTINPSECDAEECAYHMTEHHMFDTVIEITGSLKGLDTALRLCRISGRAKLLIPSLYNREETLTLPMAYNLMVRSPILHSVHPWYNPDYVGTLTQAVQTWPEGIFPTDEMITHVFPLEEIAKGFAMLVQPSRDYLKGVISFDGYH